MSTGGGGDVFQLQDNQQFDLSFEVDDARGNPLTVPVSDLNLSSSDSSLLTVTPGTGNSFVVASTGKIGSAQLNATATLNGKQLAGTLTVQVVAGDADHINLTPSNVRPV